MRSENIFLRRHPRPVSHLNCYFPTCSLVTLSLFLPSPNSTANQDTLGLNKQMMLSLDSIRWFPFTAFPRPISDDLLDRVPCYSAYMIVFFM